MRTIEELSHDTFYKMEKYSQIVIDYVEDAEHIINTDAYDREVDRQREIDSLRYDIDVLLEVMNPELTDDVLMLMELETLLNDLAHTTQ